ncbi:hypothetical protein, partial [Oscillibacter sp. UBA6647]|uniref:hypothetical protein n=1 Tax=Oscillibacter sp. UBA6647 TaxID=1947021 RepID=UPI0039C9F4BA
HVRYYIRKLLWLNRLERFLKVVPAMLFQQNKAESKVNEDQERAGELIISGCNASKVFEFEKKALYHGVNLCCLSTPAGAYQLIELAVYSPLSWVRHQKFSCA